MNKKKLIAAIFASIFIANISLASAQGIIPNASGDACPGGKDATYCGNYEVNDFISLAINISKWILGMVGSLSLIMFIYGGVLFLVSTGSTEKISKAKNILVAAVVGLIIVFTSYLIIKFVMNSMGLTWSGKIAVPKAAADAAILAGAR